MIDLPENVLFRNQKVIDKQTTDFESPLQVIYA